MPMEEEKVQSDVARTEKRSSRTVEMALLLVLGVLAGFSLKTEAAKRVTIGSDDYLVSQRDFNAYDLNALQKELIAKGETSTISAGSQATGGSCGQ